MRYFKLLRRFFIFAIMGDLGFRTNALISAVVNLVWFGTLFLGIEVVFGKVHSIAGWPKEEIYVLAVIYTFFDDFFWHFVHYNLESLLSSIYSGDFHFALLKPVNTRFLVSTRRFSFSNSLRSGLAILVLIYALRQLGVSFRWESVLTFIYLLLNGFVIIYSLFFAMTATTFWLGNLWNLENLMGKIVDLGRSPIYIFGERARKVFIYGLPIAFISTFPAEALLGRLDPKVIWIAPLLSIYFYLASEFIWRKGIKNYTGAGG